MLAELKKQLAEIYADNYPEIILSLTNEALALEQIADRANAAALEARQELAKLRATMGAE